MPRLVTQSEGLNNLKDADEYFDRFEALRREVPELLAQLYEWRWHWEADWGNRVYTILPSRNITRAYDDNGRPLFESLIWYSDLPAATDILLYNTSLILFKYLHKVLSLPEASAPSLPPGVVPKQPTTAGILHQPGEAKTTYDCAMEICRSMDFILLPVHAGPGALELLAPARFTYIHLAPESDVARWLRNVCQEIADNIGIEMSRYMIWTRPDLAREFSAADTKLPPTILDNGFDYHQQDPPSSTISKIISHP